MPTPITETILVSDKQYLLYIYEIDDLLIINISNVEPEFFNSGVSTGSTLVFTKYYRQKDFLVMEGDEVPQNIMDLIVNITQHYKLTEKIINFRLDKSY